MFSISAPKNLDYHFGIRSPRGQGCGVLANAALFGGGEGGGRLMLTVVDGGGCR